MFLALAFVFPGDVVPYARHLEIDAGGTGQFDETCAVTLGVLGYAVFDRPIGVAKIMLGVAEGFVEVQEVDGAHGLRL